MNRIDKAFEDLKSRGEKALVGFVTAGDPNISASVEIVTAMVESGLDILELGVLFPTRQPMDRSSSAHPPERLKTG